VTTARSANLQSVRMNRPTPRAARLTTHGKEPGVDLSVPHVAQPPSTSPPRGRAWPCRDAGGRSWAFLARRECAAAGS